MLVGSPYPEDLRHDTLAMCNGSLSNRRRLDTRRADSYGALADWYTEMITYYAGRGVPVDIITVVNEPVEQPRRFGVTAGLTVLREGDELVVCRGWGPELDAARLEDAAGWRRGGR